MQPGAGQWNMSQSASVWVAKSSGLRQPLGPLATAVNSVLSLLLSPW